MASDLMQQKLSIKNMLFTRAMPSLQSPIPIEGHKTYLCTDCGDRFLLEASYETHINREALTITYNCLHCHEIQIFNNRCQLLSHIRSHGFKSATINVSDLKIEPLPQHHFNSLRLELENQVKDKHGNTCYECKKVFETQDGRMHKARAEHCMQFSQDPFHTCPICLFTIPTLCGLLAHLRIHLKIPPYYCPECGFNLPNRNISYPYNHDCDGFKMMRATARSKCLIENCLAIIHPSKYQSHLRNHYNLLMRCQACFETFSKPKDHTTCPNVNFVVCFQCPLCTEIIFMKSHIEKHLKAHLHFLDVPKDVYQCHICKSIFTQLHFLLNHIIVKHDAVSLKNILSKIIKQDAIKMKKNGVYRIVKRCDKCLRSFTYRCQYENINTLPTQCPYKCSSIADSNSGNKKTYCPDSNIHNNFIVCSLCQNKIKEDWNTVKEHFASFHKSYKCLDLKLKLNKIDERLICLRKRKNKGNVNIVKGVKTNCKTKINSLIKLKKIERSTIIAKTNPTYEDMTEFSCRICNYKSENKMQLEDHIICYHKDPLMAYQCLECGQCFAVKHSFSTHLLLEHEISDFQDYIDRKQCYNELALQKSNKKSTELEEKPVQENQCKICRKQFLNSNDLEKHFRVHGMAFLMKNRNGIE